MSQKWDGRFIDLADHVAQWSKDPSTKVGAVIARADRTVASLGFNGFPRGVSDDEGRLANRDEKLARTVHAEINAILSSHVPVRGCTLYVTAPCCASCAAMIIQAGISAVVCRQPTSQFAIRWAESMGNAAEMFFEAGVQTRWVA